MKLKVWIPYLVSALLAFMLAVSAVGNLITGYGLPVTLWKIFLCSGLAAVASAVLFRFRYGGRIILGALALVCVGLWLGEVFRPHLLQQVKTLSYLLTSHYHKIYNWPIWGTPDAQSVSTPFSLWAVIVTVCVNWHICRRKHIVVAIVPTIVPLTLCLLTTDKVPAVSYLYLMILGLAILLITDWTRKKQPEQCVKMLLGSVLPIGLALALLFASNPGTQYVNRAGKLQKEVVARIEEYRSKKGGIPIDAGAGKQVNLQTVGPRSQSTTAVMRVNSPIDGMLYLRGRDYDVYTGTGWEASEKRQEKFTSCAPSIGKLTIVTYGVKSIVYVPYYATTKISMMGGALENEDNLQQYSYYIGRMLSEKTDLASSRYKKLPVETQKWAKNMARKITAGAKTDREKMLKIQNYIRKYAAYDADTARMDGAQTDFAKWFLEESKTGHCVHYATAATVLLRASGIPARYVEGYIVSSEAGKDVVVGRQNAHAWVEYYDWLTRAWYVLEATPIYPEADRPESAPGKPSTKPSEEEDAPAGTPENTPVDKPVVDTPVIETPDPPKEEPPKEEIPEEDPLIPPITEPEEPEVPDVPVQDVVPTPPVQEEAPREIPKWVKIALWSLLLIPCVLLQGYVRIYRKRKLWNRGAPNRCTIYRWRLTRSMAKRMKEVYPEELDYLAQKARFSQHEIQPEELQLFEDYRLSLLARIAEKPWYQRLVFKWLFAIA